MKKNHWIILGVVIATAIIIYLIYNSQADAGTDAPQIGMAGLPHYLIDDEISETEPILTGGDPIKGDVPIGIINPPIITIENTNIALT